GRGQETDFSLGEEDKSSSSPFAIAREGEKVIEKETLSQILELSSKLKSNLEPTINKFIISSEDKLVVVMVEDWEIYFNLQKDIEWQITKLKAVLDEKIPSEKRKDLEYIELRFGNLAPFKYKD
ncbi:unnamed protein product, partial [marine sediment metagenome]